MSERQLKAKIVRGLAWYGGTRAVLQALSWVVTIVVARLVAPSDYGLLGMALLYTGLLDFISEMGLGAAIVQREEMRDVDLDSLFWFGLATGLALYALTLALAPQVGVFFGQPELGPLLRLVGISLLATGLRIVPWNLLTRAVDFKKRSLAEVWGAVAGSVTTLSLALLGYGVWALAIGSLVPNLVMTAQAFIQTGWRPRLRLSRQGLGSHLSFSLGVAGSRGAWYLHESSDKLVVGKFLGEHDLGIYTIATRLAADLPGRFIQIVNQVAFPAYCRLQGQPGLAARYFLKSVSVASTVVFPFSIGLVLVATDLVPLLLTDRWSGLVRPMQIVCCGALIETIHSLASPIVIAKGHSAISFRYNLTCLALLPPSYWIGSFYGLNGVCLVWVTVFPFLAGYWLVRTKALIGYRWCEYWRAVRPALLGCAAMACATVAAGRFAESLRAPGRVGIEVAVGVAVYVASIFVLQPDLLRQALDGALSIRGADPDAARMN